MSETATGKGTPVLVPTLISPRSGMIILDERRGRVKDNLLSKWGCFPSARHINHKAKAGGNGLP